MTADAEPYGSGSLVVFDTSAWNRQRANDEISGRWRATLAAGALSVCPVAALEILASARDQAAFHRLDAALSALPQAPVTRTSCSAAIAASRELGGSRRLPAADYLIAAAAAERGAAILHYDRHFEPLCEALGIDSVWLAEPGSLD
ncbi:MAG: PIN domain-containing protein [Thermoleophilaceae bacterium]